MNEPTATNKKRYHRAIKLINFVPLKVKYVGINFFSALSLSFCTSSFFITLLRYIFFYFHPKKRERAQL